MRGGGQKYGGSFRPFISEQLGPISQPEWIKESEMDCVDCSFVLLDSLFCVILQCQIHGRIHSLFGTKLIVGLTLYWRQFHWLFSSTF